MHGVDWYEFYIIQVQVIFFMNFTRTDHINVNLYWLFLFAWIAIKIAIF